MIQNQAREFALSDSPWLGAGTPASNYLPATHSNYLPREKDNPIGMRQLEVYLLMTLEKHRWRKHFTTEG